MPLYNFQAIDSKGQKKSGLIEAHDPKEAKEKLRAQGVMVKSLEQKTKALAKENLKGESLETFTLLLGQLVNSGLPIYESLLALEEQFRDEKFHRVILSICDRVKGGAKLSDAMRTFPQSFNQIYTSMIDAGESAGALGPVLEKLADLLQKQTKLQGEITTSMIYPLILFSFALVLISTLFGFVIPSLEGIFMGRELNTFTKTILAISYVFRTYWWVWMPLLAVSVGGTAFWLNSAPGRLWLQKKALTLPFVKRLVIETALARFCRTMATLQKGGLTVVDSMKIAQFVMNNVYLQDEMHQAELRIVEGSSLSRELAKSKYIPQMVSRMLKVGEESGTLGSMFERIGDIYERDLEKSLKRILALLQPVILIFMGTIVLTVLLAVLVPLTDLSSFKF